MAAIARATASEAASTGSSLPSQRAQATPISADTRWPPNIGQGCDSAPWGAANSSTADAPIEATIRTVLLPLPSTKWLAHSTASIPSRPPPAEIQCSRSETV